MVEEYVKDMYRIGLILFFTPLVLGLLGLVVAAALGQPIDFNAYKEMIALFSPPLTGVLIILYVSIKYYYKEGYRTVKYGKT